MKNAKVRKLAASVMAAIMAATAVPAALSSAVFVTPDLGISETKTATLATMGVDSVYKGTITDYVKSGAKSITFTLMSSDYETSFSYGFGIGISEKPYWTEHNEEGGWDTKGSGYSVTLKKGVATEVTIDLTDLELDYSTNAKFEFRCYYSAHWDNSKKDMVDNKVTLTDVSVNGGASTPDPKPSTESKNRKSNGENCEDGKSWSFVDNGDGTATITSTVARQLSDLDLTLTQGYDEEYYIANPDEAGENAPINSHKFAYSDFGITNGDGITIESLTAVIESDVDLDTFMFGGGLNVEAKSPADTEYAKQVAGIEGKESAGYWYNDMGAESVEEFEDAGVEFGVTVGNGVELSSAGSYINAYWEVPTEVQPYATVRANDTLSFQYWWGCDTDGEVVPEVTLSEAVLTYTKEITIPYTDKVTTAVKKAVEHVSKTNYVEIPYSDLGIDESKEVYAVLFDITAKSDIGKLVYNVGTSAEITGDWFQEDQSYCVLEAGDSAEIMWLPPANLLKSSSDGTDSLINSTKYGNLQFAYYWGEPDAVTVNNITVYYADAPTTTTTTTTTSTTTTTTTTQPPTEPDVEVSLWGDANVDGKVDLQDAVAILQYVALEAKYPLTPVGKLNADVVDNGSSGVNGTDALAIQMADANLFDGPIRPMTNADLNTYIH